MCDGGGKTTSLEGLLQAIEAFLGGPPIELTAYELGFAREAAVFATTEEYEAQGSTSPIDWVRHQCGMSGNAAARAIATGEQLESLPASVAALEAGRIGFAHLALPAGTARALRTTTLGPVPDDAPGSDAPAGMASAGDTAAGIATVAGATGFEEVPCSPSSSSTRWAASPLTAPTPATPAMPPGCSPSRSARSRTGAST
ncbi:MAG TPA: hypothetical protein VIO13_01760 [Candidatus Dormibacteraeota bacterium]|jgi:hypothetical protein